MNNNLKVLYDIKGKLIDDLYKLTKEYDNTGICIIYDKINIIECKINNIINGDL